MPLPKPFGRAKLAPDVEDSIRKTLLTRLRNRDTVVRVYENAVKELADQYAVSPAHIERIAQAEVLPKENPLGEARKRLDAQRAKPGCPVQPVRHFRARTR